MGDTIRIALAQINTIVGDLQGNKNKIMEYIDRAHAAGSDIVCFPELAVTGYPPEDLLLKPQFVKDNIQVMEDISKHVPSLVTVIGFVNQEDDRLYNAASVIYNGTIKGIYHKALLPNYGVFDEKRYFKAGGEPIVFAYGEVRFGVNICEDIWFKEGPTKLQAMASARLILNINGSPYHVGKIKMREQAIIKQAREYQIFVVYTNMVGGQDELVFDGGSMVVDKEGYIIAQANQFKEELLIVDISVSSLTVQSNGLQQKRQWFQKSAIEITDKIPLKERTEVVSPPVHKLETEAEIYNALILGLYDYVYKNGFSKVVIGLSGGIDSSLVCAIACDALGNKNVTGVFLPSYYTSHESRTDVYDLARNLDVSVMEIPIDSICSAYLSSLYEFFKDLKEDITEENIQARIRGNIIMALSNKFGWLVLTTGNKSEMSVGYATLYGDMAGGFAVIKDVPKTMVYRLARYRNTISPVIPHNVLIKEPTAELKPNQKDSDTLPPYEVLDPILKLYIEEDKELHEIVATGIDAETAERVLRMVDLSEYKRRQAPPGIKITPKAFGKDRRMPITNRYKQ